MGMEKMKKIFLTGKYGRGKFVLVDDKNYQSLNRWKWCLHSKYATRTQFIRKVNGKQITKTIRMHQQILKTPKGRQIDHVNGNKLDNRESNLRIATVSQNSYNRGPQKNSRSGLKGVYWHKCKEKWQVCIQAKRKFIYLGYYLDKYKAAEIYNEMAKKLHGKFARLNQL